MRILLDTYYSGVPSSNRGISAGEYTHDDLRLFGLAGYLVKTGHASVIEDDLVTLDEMTVEQLKTLATERGLNFKPRATKVELLALLSISSAEEDDNGNLD